MKVLSIEAWAESENDDGEEIIHWNWNNWFKVGETDKPVETIEQAWEQFESYFGILPRFIYGIEDDQYNFVLVLLDQNNRPIYAIEYGSEQ